MVLPLFPNRIHDFSMFHTSHSAIQYSEQWNEWWLLHVVGSLCPTIQRVLHPFNMLGLMFHCSCALLNVFCNVCPSSTRELCKLSVPLLDIMKYVLQFLQTFSNPTTVYYANSLGISVSILYVLYIFLAKNSTNTLLKGRFKCPTFSFHYCILVIFGLSTPQKFWFRI